MKQIRFMIVKSESVPGQVSIRPVDQHGRPVKHKRRTLQVALTEAGFEDGDLVELKLVNDDQVIE